MTDVQTASADATAVTTPPAGETVPATPATQQGSSPKEPDKPVVNTEAFIQSRVEQAVRLATKTLTDEITGLKELLKPKETPPKNDTPAQGSSPKLEDVLASNEKTNKMILVNAEIAKRGDINPKAVSEFIRNLKMDSLKINPESYLLEGFDEQVTALKEQKDFLFINKEQVKLGSISDGIDTTKYAPEVIRLAQVYGIKDAAVLADMQKVEEQKQRVLSHLVGSPNQKKKA